jgi:hypothetical protein
LVLASLALVPATVWDSATVDEPDHLTAGLAYWKTGNFSIGCDHPPLGRMWAALPVLFLNPTVALPSEQAQMRELYEKGVETLFYKDNPAGAMLFLGRLANWLLVCGAALFLYSWSSRLFGTWGGLCASLAFLLNPGILAHGRLITTDMGACFGYLLGCWGLARISTRANLKNLLAGTFLVALALCAKFNTAPLLGVLVIAGIVGSRTMEKGVAPSRFDYWKKSITVLVGSAVALFGFVWGIYLFQLGSIGPILNAFLVENGTDLGAVTGGLPGGTREAVRWVLEKAPVPFPALWSGLAIVAKVQREAFLFGTHSATGWWYYLPVAFLLKTPAPLLILYFAGLLATLKKIGRRPERRELIVVVAAIAAYWCVGCLARWSIGYRHLLPVIPLHALLVGALLEGGCAGATSAPSSRKNGVWIGLLLAFALLGVVWQYPRYISYFNILCGGSTNGYRSLIDSNCDWGQDVLRLKAYCERHKIDRAAGEIFCPDNLDYHGLKIDLPETFGEFRRRIEKGEYGFVSVNYLQGITAEARERWKGLIDLPPRDRVGESIFVYGGPP